MLSRLTTWTCAALIASWASAGFARPPELPAELRGLVAIEVTRCRPVGHADALLEADVRVRARQAAISLPGLHCGAYDDAGEALFLTPVARRLQLRAGKAQQITARFAADATHRECGCTLRNGRELDAERERLAAVNAGFDALIAEISGEQTTVEREPAPAATSEVSAAPPKPASAEPELLVAFAPPALRYERMLAPNAPLRAEASARAAITGIVEPGERIAVDRIERGWKLARTPAGLTGWLPGDASTADIAAPERMAERLAPLHEALAPGASTSEALCASVQRSALSDLVAAWRLEERTVYVRPLWYALTREDRAVFQSWAADCYSTARLIDSTSGEEIQSGEREVPR